MKAIKSLTLLSILIVLVAAVVKSQGFAGSAEVVKRQLALDVMALISTLILVAVISMLVKNIKLRGFLIIAIPLVMLLGYFFYVAGFPPNPAMTAKLAREFILSILVVISFVATHRLLGR